MSRIHNFIVTSFLYLIPAGLVLLMMAQFEMYYLVGDNVWGDCLAVIALYWILCSGYVLTALVLNKNFRETIFFKLSGIKERDEREEMIVSRAMKASFIFMMATLTLLLVLSTTRTMILKSPDKEVSGNLSTGSAEIREKPLKVGEGLKGSFTIGHLEFRGDPLRVSKAKVNGELESFDVYDIPLSKTSLIFIILLLQLLSYQVFSRRLLRA